MFEIALTGKVEMSELTEAIVENMDHIQILRFFEDIDETIAEVEFTRMVRDNFQQALEHEGVE